jgi:hypothetical protein
LAYTISILRRVRVGYSVTLRYSQAGGLALLSMCLLAIGNTCGWAASPYTTQGFDNSRSNWNPNEALLSVSSVSSGFGPWFKVPVDAQVYAQPLYLPNLNMGYGLGTHNVVFVVTEGNTLYAFDADVGKQLYKRSVMPRGETFQISTDYASGAIPQMGVTATPVIDTSSNTIYLVAASKTTSSPVAYHQRLHTIDVTTGLDRIGPRDILAKYPGTGGMQDGHGNVVFNPLTQYDRAALLLFNGQVWTAFSSHFDVGIYQGWVIAYDKTTLSQEGVYDTAPDISHGASIWQAGDGLAADSDSVYFETANGAFDVDSGGVDYGDSAIRLGRNFHVLDYFTPCNQQTLDDNDVDLGSGGPMLIPKQSNGSHPYLMTFAGKEGSIYLVDRANMGKYTPTTLPDNQECQDNVVQELWRVLGLNPTTSSARNAHWGPSAYYRDASDHQTVYYSGNGNSIFAYSLANGTLTPGSINGETNQTPDTYPAGGTFPAVSSNGSVAGSAVLWAIKRNASSDGNAPLSLEAYDATNLTDQIVTDLPAGNWKLIRAFVTPTVANGKVYVASDGELDAFALTSSASEAVKIATPAYGSTVLGTVSIQTQDISQVRWETVYIDGNHIATLGSMLPYTLSWDSATVADGQHTISVIAYNANHTQIGADLVTVSVNN